MPKYRYTVHFKPEALHIGAPRRSMTLMVAADSKAEARTRAIREARARTALPASAVLAAVGFKVDACTGAVDPDDGTISHDGPTCPVHEAIQAVRRTNR